MAQFTKNGIPHLTRRTKPKPRQPHGSRMPASRCGSSVMEESQLRPIGQPSPCQHQALTPPPQARQVGCAGLLALGLPLALRRRIGSYRAWCPLQWIVSPFLFFFYGVETWSAYCRPQKTESPATDSSSGAHSLDSNLGQCTPDTIILHTKQHQAALNSKTTPPPVRLSAVLRR